MARPKLGEGETYRLHVKISDEELAAIDDWRFNNRVSSRSEAVRRLCQIGLLVDAELENIVDTGIRLDDMMAAKTLQAVHLREQHLRSKHSLPTAGNIEDMLRENVEWSEDLSYLATFERTALVGLWNAFAALVARKDLKEASANATASIDETGTVLESLNQRQERFEEDRLLVEVSATWDDEMNARWEAMSDDEADAFVKAELKRRRGEEEQSEA